MLCFSFSNPCFLPIPYASFLCTFSQNFRLCRYWPALLVPTGSIRPFLSTSWRRKWTAEWPMTINSSGKNSTYVHKHTTTVVLQSRMDRLEMSSLEWHKNMASKIHNIHLWCWCVSPRYALSPCELVGLTVSLLCRRCLCVPFRPHVMLPRRRRIRRRTDMSTSCPVRLSHNLSPNQSW